MANVKFIGKDYKGSSHNLNGSLGVVSNGNSKSKERRVIQ